MIGEYFWSDFVEMLLKLNLMAKLKNLFRYLNRILVGKCLLNSYHQTFSNQQICLFLSGQNPEINKFKYSQAGYEPENDLRFNG